MCENIGKNISKNLRGKYSKTLLDHAKQSPAFKTALKFKKKTEATGDLIGNKIADRITKV